MHLIISITTNFDADKEKAYWDGDEHYPPQYFPTDMMRDGLNDFLDEAGLGIGSKNNGCWSDFFKEEYGWIPTMRVAFVNEIPHNEDNWMHVMGRDRNRNDGGA